MLSKNMYTLIGLIFKNYLLLYFANNCFMFRVTVKYFEYFALGTVVTQSYKVG